MLGVKVPLRSSSSAARSAGRSSATGSTSSAATSTTALPQTTIANTAFPAFNITLEGKESDAHLDAARLDYQLSPANRLMVKGNLTTFKSPFSAARQRPSGRLGRRRTRPTTCRLQFDVGARATARQRGQGRLRRLRFTEANLTTWSNHPLREPRASPTATRASSSPASTSPATTTGRATGSRTPTTCATTSRCRTTSAAATT